MVPMTICPKCAGYGRPRFPNDTEPCVLCGGEGALPADFAEKTAAPRREKVWASCEDCLDVRWCVWVERDGMQVPLCARCYTREMHPHLLATVDMATAPF